eukprot:jgi/Botrbrau1/8732/Bobra.0090s0008.1
MLTQGVCILRTRSGPADAEALQRAGYKIRYSSSILPDLLFSKRGISIALIFVANNNDFPLERVMDMKNGFRHAFVLTSSKLTLEMAGCSTRVENYPPIIAGLVESSLTQYAIDLIEDYIIMHEKAGEGQGSSFMSGDTYCDIINTICGISLNQFQVSAMRMLGSIDQLANCTAHNLMSMTDLDQGQCNQLLNFFSQPLPGTAGNI